MLEIMFLIVLALIWIIAASVQDLKKREVPNWLNFSLIIFVLGFRLFYSLFSETGFNFFYQGLIGLGIFFILGNALYYARMFAGGDAKLMIAMGAILPFSEDFFINLNTFIWFLLLFMFAGAIYGFVWSFVLAVRNVKNFKKEFSNLLRKNKMLVYFVLFFGLVLIVLGFFMNILFYIGALIFIMPYFYLYAKSVDESCMVKKVKVNELVEGDWLYKDVKIGRKTIKAKWDGLNKNEIGLIKKNKKQVVIRQGIPFVPVFLISFLVLIYLFYLK